MEVVALKVCDVDSKRMMIRVEQGKGRKDRHAMLSPRLLELLRDWWRIAHPVDVPRPGSHQPDDDAPTQSGLTRSPRR
jgi:integrase/recombinase XerD